MLYPNTNILHKGHPQRQRKGWWNMWGPLLEASLKAYPLSTGVWRNWEPYPNHSTTKYIFPGAGVFTMERFLPGHLKQASSGSNLSKTCLYFSTQLIQLLKLLRKENNEKQLLLPWATDRTKPQSVPWAWVLQTGKQGAGTLLQATQEPTYKARQLQQPNRQPVLDLVPRR